MSTPHEDSQPDPLNNEVEIDHTDKIAPADFVGEHVEKIVIAGEAFDPTRHATNPDGTPRLKVDGTLAAKRGRKAGGAAPSPSSTAPPVPSQGEGATVAPDPGLSSLATAKIVFGAATGLAARIIGPEWGAEDKEEEKYMVSALKLYFDAKGTVEISPELGLFIAVASYSSARFRHENTRSKFAKFKTWVKDAYHWARGKWGKK